MKNTQTKKMGRPPIYTNDKQRQKAYKVSLAKSNEKRRKQYAENPEYRTKVLVRNRSRYASTRAQGVKRRVVRKPSIARIDKYTERLKVVDAVTGKASTKNVLHFQNTGDFLGIGRSSIYRWQQQGKLPKPTMFTKEGEHFVYSKEQIMAIASVINKECEGRVSYYRATDDRVVAAVYEAFANA